ncbi:uncharacterized protein MELLADRAFT_69022, partial [Melampsora larici-populina 98AG31]
MAPTNFNKPLKKIRTNPKPVTDRQLAFLAQKKRDQHQTIKSQSHFIRRKNGVKTGEGSNDAPSQDATWPDDGMTNPGFDDLEDQYRQGYDPAQATNLDDYTDEDGWEDVDEM